MTSERVSSTPPRSSLIAKEGSVESGEGLQDQPNTRAMANPHPAGPAGSPVPPTILTTANIRSVGPGNYGEVILLADILDDLEKVRIANENRLRTLSRDRDEHGKGVPLGAVEHISDLIAQLEALENGATLALKRAVRRSPLGAFQKATLGLGEKTLGRLLKEIGDPAWNGAEQRPRKLRELYAYCGLHVILPAQTRFDSQDHRGGKTERGGDAQPMGDSHITTGVAPSRIRGEQANWSTQAKMRVFLIAESMIKNRRSAYRPVYDEGRERYAEAVHQVECRRCGPSGNPAEVGSPLNDGHKHARAMRLVMKAVLRDIWRAAGGG